MNKNLKLLIILLSMVGVSSSFISTHAQVKPVAYDISQYQGAINNRQTKNLKNEVKFIILRNQNGKYMDSRFRHNSYEMSRNNIPYGAYEDDSYINPTQARTEALALYRRAPNARFYVNNPVADNERKSFSFNRFNNSTVAWANEIKRVAHRPAILYSTLSFMNHMFNQRTRNSYNALWTADYSNEPDPKWHYDLWQYSNHKYSRALGKYVDASAVPYGGRKISFWIGNSKSRYTKKRTKHITRHIVKKPRMHINSVRRTRKVHKRDTNYIDPNYYYSPNIKHFEVIARHGVNIYDLYSHYVRHFRIGSILHVNYFKSYRYHKNDYHTIAIGTYHHKAIMFTTRKSVVYPYYFN